MFGFWLEVGVSSYIGGTYNVLHSLRSATQLTSGSWDPYDSEIDEIVLHPEELQLTLVTWGPMLISVLP